MPDLILKNNKKTSIQNKLLCNTNVIILISKIYRVGQK